MKYAQLIILGMLCCLGGSAYAKSSVTFASDATPATPVQQEAPAPVTPPKDEPQEAPLTGLWPYTSRTDAPMKIRPVKSCREYLSTCEKSCADRGNVFRFSCIGPDFQPYSDHSRCQCGEDAFSQVSSAQGHSKVVIAQERDQ